MIVTFCGHGQIHLNDDEEQRFERELRRVLVNCPDAVFYLGDYGKFDLLCNNYLRRLQIEFPLLRRVFVTPYLDPEYSHLRNADEYDEILYPFTDRVVKKYAILLRNQWMVDSADLLIACVKYSWGGAAKTLSYAAKKKKSYINIACGE